MQNKRPVNKQTTKQKQEAISKQDQEAATRLRARIGRYLPVDLDVDTSYLNNTQEQVLETLVRAAQYMDKIFELQVRTYLDLTMLPGLGWFAREKGGFGGEG